MSGFIGALVGIIVTLLVAGLIYWAIQQLLPLIPLPEPFARIIHILLIVIMFLIVIWVILVLLGAAGVRTPFYSWQIPSGVFAAISRPATQHMP